MPRTFLNLYCPFVATNLIFFFPPISLSTISVQSDLIFFCEKLLKCFLMKQVGNLNITQGKVKRVFSSTSARHRFISSNCCLLAELFTATDGSQLVQFYSTDSLTVNHVFIELENQIKFVGDLNNTQEKVKRVFSSTSARFISLNCCLLAQLFTTMQGLRQEFRSTGSLVLKNPIVS